MRQGETKKQKKTKKTKKTKKHFFKLILYHSLHTNNHV